MAFRIRRGSCKILRNLKRERSNKARNKIRAKSVLIIYESAARGIQVIILAKNYDYIKPSYRGYEKNGTRNYWFKASA